MILCFVKNVLLFYYTSFAVTESDVYKKLVEMENLAETRLKSISLLETQKFDLVQGNVKENYKILLFIFSCKWSPNNESILFYF